MLGAVLLDERHLFSLLVEEHLRPEHFYVERHALVFGAMLALHNSDRKIDHLTVAEALRAERQARGGRGTGGDRGARRLGARRRPRPRLRADRPRAGADAGAAHRLLRDPGERPVPGRAGPGAGRAGRAADARGRPRRPPEEDPPDRRHPPRGDRQAPSPVGAEDLAHRDAVGLQGPRRDDRRLPARQPDHHRRPPVDGQVGARGQHRRERRLLANVRWRCSRWRCPSPSSPSGSSPPRPGSRARSSGGARSPSTAGRRSSTPATGSRRAPLFVDDSSDTGVLEVRAKCPAAAPPDRGRAQADHRRLPPADAPRGPGREPGRAGEPDLPRAEGAGPGARRAGDRALAAQPRASSSAAATRSRSSRTCATPARSSRTPTW